MTGTTEDLILVVEDSDSDVEAIERAISRTHPDVRLEFLRSGTDVLPRLTAPGSALPGLILLDLNMPGDGGLETIRRIRLHPEFGEVSIVVFTSSEDQAEADACHAAGADSYIYKPVNFALFQTVLRQTLNYWRSRSSSGKVAHIVVPPPGDSSAHT